MSKTEKYTVTKNQLDLAVRRTEFLMERLIKWDYPIRLALASAYFQGMADLMEVASKRELSHE